MTTSCSEMSGRRILLVEDEYFIADDMARAFEDSGAEIVGPVASVEDAFAMVSATERLDAAVLDINLQGKPVFPLADELAARGVRFVFATGYDHHAIPPRFDHIVRCEKPTAPAAVASALFRS